VLLRARDLRVPTGGGNRGPIQGFSAASRRRLIDKMLLFPWSEFVDSDKHRPQADCVLLTLTYPAQYPSHFEIHKRHLDSFHKRLGRARDSGFAAFWRLEYQRRGAPHYHILIAFDQQVSVRALQDWARRAWFEVVDSGDRRHLDHGVDVRPVYQPAGGPGALVRYLVKYLGKLDESTGHTGRCWGEWGEMPEACRCATVFETREGFVEFLRRVRRWGKRSRYLRRIHNVHGLRLYGDGPSILLQLTQGLDGVLTYIT
jgi:hypothetical protein